MYIFMSLYFKNTLSVNKPKWIYFYTFDYFKDACMKRLKGLAFLKWVLYRAEDDFQISKFSCVKIKAV